MLYNRKLKKLPYNITFIRPPTLTVQNAVGQDAVPPLGLAYLVGSIVDKVNSVTVIDAVGEKINKYSISYEYPDLLIHGLTIDEIIKKIPKNTDIICISCMFSLEWLFDRKLINIIKEKNPDVLIIIGGEHATALSEYLIEDCSSIDFIIKGEGEFVLNNLLNAYYNKDLKKINGIIYKNGNKIVNTDWYEEIVCLDDYNNPAWDLFPIENYIDNSYNHGVNMGRSFPILASRGCPYNCTFCSSAQMWRRKWRVRSPKKIIKEMKLYKEKYNVNNFNFYDITAIIHRDWIIEFCELIIENNLNITWQLSSGTRSEVVDDKVAELLYKSGCVNIVFAPESGSTEELKRLKKGLNLDNMLTAMKIGYSKGLKIKANFVFGFPKSTMKDVYETYKIILKMAFIGIHNISPFQYSPYPGGELFDELLKNKKIKLNDEYFMTLLDCTYPDRINSFNDSLKPKKIKKIIIISLLLFYSISFLLRPIRIFRELFLYLTGKYSSKLTTAIFTKKRRNYVKKIFLQTNCNSVEIPNLIKIRSGKERNK